MQWKTGLIVRISNYKFEDNNSTRNKYAIVLYANDHEAYLIHSLTTSKNNPGVSAIHYGCSVSGNVPYYFIPKGQVIGNEDFSFEFDTFIFFRGNIRKASYLKFQEASKTLFGITILGMLHGDELKRIIKCALKSKFLPSDIEEELTTVKQSL
jgi:hypothetical protein